jgi:hypothetical protein
MLSNSLCVLLSLVRHSLLVVNIIYMNPKWIRCLGLISQARVWMLSEISLCFGVKLFIKLNNNKSENRNIIL